MKSLPVFKKEAVEKALGIRLKNFTWLNYCRQAYREELNNVMKQTTKTK